MSLVAYGSSDESDLEETSVVPESKPSAGLFSLLPAPKTSESSTGVTEGASKESKANIWPRDSSSNDDLDPQPAKVCSLSSLPKPKKRTEPVKIPVPEIQRQDVSTSPSTATYSQFLHVLISNLIECMNSLPIVRLGWWWTCKEKITSSGKNMCNWMRNS